MRIIFFLWVFSLFCIACGGKDETAEKAPDIRFERSKWDARDGDGNYTYRRQMINDLLHHYQWPGMKKDSLVRMLGEPDLIEEGAFMYYYEKKRGFGGFGTMIETIVFEIAPDSTVKKARLNDGGWD